LCLLFAIVFLIGVSYYLGWSRYELPLFHRFWLRRESALVLRALALAVRQQQPLGAALVLLAEQYPKARVAARLSRASAAVASGVPWCDALRRVGLLRELEAGVLRSAERAGNLAWALDEMADSTLRRFVLRLRALLGLLFPVLVLVLGAAVGLFVTSLFLPLVSLIQGLS
jgi:type II secretory pathway component PulF